MMHTLWAVIRAGWHYWCRNAAMQQLVARQEDGAISAVWACRTIAEINERTERIKQLGEEIDARAGA